MDTTSSFEKLASALFGGPVVAVDIKVVPGTAGAMDRETASAALLASMERTGLVVDGRLTDRLRPRTG